MLLTIAPNPTLDRTLHVPRMSIGEVHRATQVHLAAGGKGLNVTRVARLLDCPVLTTGLLGGRAGQIYADLADAEGFQADWYWLKTGETRTCILINHNASDATVINEPGPMVSSEDWAGLAAHVTRLAEHAGAIAFSGSLPPGVAGEALAALARSLATPDRAVYVDTSAAPLAAVLEKPTGLCIKVNRTELATGLGLTLEDIPTIVKASRLLLTQGATLVVVTLGAAGTLAVAPEGCWQVDAPSVEVVSTVGSGDSLLAGLAVARLKGYNLEAALAQGVACGTANATTRLPARVERTTVEALLRQIRVQRLEI